MIKSKVKDVEVSDKTYTIVKKGVSTSFEVKSVFMRIVIQSGIKMDDSYTDSDYVKAMMAGMYGNVLDDFKSIIMQTVSAPEITEDSYEDMEPNDLMMLFQEIFDFYFSSADDKKKEQNKSSIEPEQVTSLKI